MTLLIAGLLLFFSVHALPMHRVWREAVAARLGSGPYRALFSMVSMTGLILMIIGMSRAPVIKAWEPPAWGNVATALLMLASLYCLMATYLPSRLRTMTAHPMLWGITFWSGGHMLANGNWASMLLFGTFFAYSLIDRVSANRRGAKPRSDGVGIRREAMVLVATAGSFIALVIAHPWLTGVAVLKFS